ncbi:MAG: NAD(P)/FAD-dependent oxidoreductase [Actinobacteria bacterium]|nr:NAD(P)/FAD-dependent oxidoreductase [Actinomycetota bacterium]
MADYDVIIVGSGPAGIFAALELAKNEKIKTLILEKGPDVGKRSCAERLTGKCINCDPCRITSGWGGAGAFSDGKLTLSTEVGGWLGDYIGNQELASLISYVDDTYRQFGAPVEVHGTGDENIRQLQRQAVLADMRLVPMRVRHLGTDRCYDIIKLMKDRLESHIDIRAGVQVVNLLTEDGRVTGVQTAKGEEITGDYVVVGPGREGADWLNTEVRRLGLSPVSNEIDIGVRVEVPAVVMEPLTKELYEPKLIYNSRSFEDRVRTFCVCPYGVVASESTDGITTVNGHSYAGKKTENTNFALLVSTAFTEPFNEPIAYGKYIARLANLLGDGIIIQRLGDLMDGRRSTPERIARGTTVPTFTDATPGDLSFVLPYRYLSDIKEMLTALDKLAPGVNSRNTLLYGVEVKFYSSRLKLTSTLETEIENLYAIGDGAGVTRGLMQSSASGVVAARAILSSIAGRK